MTAATFVLVVYGTFSLVHDLISRRDRPALVNLVLRYE